MGGLFRGVLFGLIAVVAIAGGWIGFNLYRDRVAADKPFGGPFELVDMYGKPITEKAFRGHPSTLFFGYTHCPDVCPTTLFELDGWFKKLGDQGKSLKAYYVTVDPERDTQKVMREYVTSVSDRITGITGDVKPIHAMLKEFGVYYRRVPGEDGEYTMDHTASVFLLDSAGRLRGTIAYGENPDSALAKLRRLTSQ